MNTFYSSHLAIIPDPVGNLMSNSPKIVQIEQHRVQRFRNLEKCLRALCTEYINMMTNKIKQGCSVPDVKYEVYQKLRIFWYSRECANYEKEVYSICLPVFTTIHDFFYDKLLHQLLLTFPRKNTHHNISLAADIEDKLLDKLFEYMTFHMFRRCPNCR